MRGRARAAQLAGVSALAIMASFALLSRPAAACEAEAIGGGDLFETDFVTVTCNDEDAQIENSLFTTSHDGASGALSYDGFGDDELTINGGVIANIPIGDFFPPTPPVTNLTDSSLGTSEVALQTLSGDDTVTINGGIIVGDIDGGEGNDTISVNGGEIGGSVLGDQIVFEQGDDTIAASGGTIFGSILAGGGNDTVTVSGSALIGVAGEEIDSVLLEDGGDTFTMSGGTLTSGVDGGAGTDTMILSGGLVGGNVFGGDDDDTIGVSGAAVISGDVDGGAGNDTIQVSGGSIAGSVFGDTFADVPGNDTIVVSGGSVGGSIFAGGGADAVTISGTAQVAGDVLGEAGDDTINVSGGTVQGAVLGGDGADKVTVSGGTIKGDINAETVQLNGGTILGDITGLSENTLIIQAENLSLRDGVLFQGTNVVGTVTGTNILTGSVNFAGFSSFTLDGGSTLRLAPGVQQIASLQVLDGSTLEIAGPVSLVAPSGGLGNLVVTNAAISMQNGSPTDVFSVGDIALNNATIAIDVNAQQGLSDLISAASVSASGANLISVNLVGPDFINANVVPLAPITGETAPAGGAPSALFSVTGSPSTLAALFQFSVITGPGGGLYLLVTPTAEALTTILEPRAAIDSQPIETVMMTVYDILNDTVLTHFNLLVSANRADAAPSFGIYASGQAAYVKHDGFDITGGGISGQGPGFTANDFSLAASVELNAAEYFGIDQSYGLDVGVFGGYASSAVELDPTQFFDDIGQGDNKSAMIGSYGLFRQGTSYGLVSATGFFGNTDITNDILSSTGEYATAGVAVTGSAGHVYQINDNWRFDLRGGILGVYFQGDPFEDSQGNDFGRSRISFGAVKLEPGIFAQYPMEDGRILSPYARLELTQRFGYENTSSLEGVDYYFDDSDFSLSLSGGVNYQVTKTTTVSSELRSKYSDDSTTFAGKIGIKARF